MIVVGVDGLGPGWIATVVVDGEFAGASAFDGLEGLLAAVPDATAIVANVPLGLVAHGWRRCDALVRAFVGGERDCVLQVPPRPALEEPDPVRASALCRDLTGGLVALPSNSIRSRIMEADTVIRGYGLGGGAARSAARPSIPPCSSLEPRPSRRRGASLRVDYRGDLRSLARAIRRDSIAPVRRSTRPGSPPAGRIVEGHAEASFRLLHGHPLETLRATEAGRAQRIELLRSAGIEIPAETGRVGGVAIDDVLDAAALAWTAKRYAHGHARSFPPQEKWQLDGGRVVAIWV
jgi:predicted RNase H-like nuclease